MDVKKKITVSVPVVITGRAKGVKEGGILEEILREISVECLPKDIPNSYEVDVTELEVGHSIHVNTLEIAEGVTLITDPDDTIVAVQAPKVEKVEVEEEELEGEEGAEDEEGETTDEESSEE